MESYWSHLQVENSSLAIWCPPSPTLQEGQGCIPVESRSGGWQVGTPLNSCDACWYDFNAKYKDSIEIKKVKGRKEARRSLKGRGG